MQIQGVTAHSLALKDPIGCFTTPHNAPSKIACLDPEAHDSQLQNPCLPLSMVSLMDWVAASYSETPEELHKELTGTFNSLAHWMMVCG